GGAARDRCAVFFADIPDDGSWTDLYRRAADSLRLPAHPDVHAADGPLCSILAECRHPFFRPVPSACDLCADGDSGMVVPDGLLSHPDPVGGKGLRAGPGGHGATRWKSYPVRAYGAQPA